MTNPDQPAAGAADVPPENAATNGEQGADVAADRTTGAAADSTGNASTDQQATEKSTSEEELLAALEQDLESATDDVDESAALANQLQERTEDLQRVTAEYANFRRRTDRDRQALIASTKSSVVASFLPVLDDLDLANQHGDLTGPIKAVADKLESVFTGLEVRRFGTPGDSFDPEIHEAVQDLSAGETKVLGTVLRPGYMIGDKLIRTAMVIIDDPAAEDTNPSAAHSDEDRSGE
ncbi:nucleotide exchange factor GrpE [Corynebacterium choanae]|uniref:Protein GrpE n=1 Tax=Corynebacterium choanae TaxID=1862358 RepID=A0A3G6J3Y2_9CORY|nr:nucleotide exchange factor GrpE [Corynebacterium choanae]AZA12632.1 heat shock protein GrpE [Corynebacterium choanae]